MPLSFWTAYVVKLAVLGAVLAALYVIAGKLRRWRFLGAGTSRLLRVVETRVLSSHAAIHVVQVGPRYLLIGTATGAISTLGEVDSFEIPRQDDLGV